MVLNRWGNQWKRLFDRVYKTTSSEGRTAKQDHQIIPKWFNFEYTEYNQNQNDYLDKLIVLLNDI